MKNKILLLLFFAVIVALPTRLSAQIYFGAGLEYMVPLGEMSDVNKNAIGISLQLENRMYCQLWYGLRLDYFSPKAEDSLSIDQHFYKGIFIVSPTLRYNFIHGDCEKYSLIPYVQGMLNLSTMNNSDKLNQLGIGASLGGGICYSFTLFKHCWMLDINALYASPNAFLRAEGRSLAQSINVGLSLSVKL